MASRISEVSKIKIKFLRRRGYSIPEISTMANIPKSSVLRYISGVKISSKYKSRWLERRNASKVRSLKNWEIAKSEAIDLVPKISNREAVLIIASLYWSEGSKKDFSFSNTDPEMIKVFLKILRSVFKVNNDDLKFSIRIYSDLNLNKCINFWSKVAGVKLNHKASVNILEGSKNGKLKYGMFRVRVRKGGLLLKTMFSIINRLQLLIIKSP